VLGRVLLFTAARPDRLFFYGGRLPGSKRVLMDNTIISAIIGKFKELLTTKIDPATRAMLIRFLAKEKAKLKPLPNRKKNVAKLGGHRFNACI
jgi:hypothetical protein